MWDVNELHEVYSFITVDGATVLIPYNQSTTPLYQTGVNVSIRAPFTISFNGVQIDNSATNARVRLVFEDDTVSELYITNSTGTARNFNSGTYSKNLKSIRFNWSNLNDGFSFKNVMLNTGDTALPYEPYGYKIPITCAGQTTPVYLGEVPTVRRVKKRVLDGTENWVRQSGQSVDYFRIENMPATASKVICSHYQSPDENIAYATVVTGIKMQTSASSGVILACRPPDIATLSLSDFKAYLASEYAAGHPVTIWYVLASEETGITNEPLAKIGEYADELNSTDAGVSIPTAEGQNTLTVDTDLQPSEMTITYIKEGQ